ncbi:nicotinate phosphoribosyltransferase [Patescibacteria group bacterium]|nr:nicotinate phosphoribosyltransferase [Patescibacteria group bacterium]MBU0879531.1 nicotinate phosphoribosyltransferase [Patescibacteria group bacterium]MBU0880392.1 nicotinate phosphoribosyltransferase [Patescibacteria group bacterium]MBU0897770.1 nicotinate phosphoribosyltransferase [Patescibacteria group bacterium]MBU1991672.1 nicotinate phosphoribosyltransferase [Patescibacteria group bacterium]
MNKKEWIIDSLLDVDFYKFTMGQLVFLKYPDVPVKYAFKNRTKRVKLVEIINENELRVELNHVRELRFNNSELHYLRGTNEYGERMFAESYLDFLKDLQLPEYHLEYDDDTIRLEFVGKWSESIYWETIALAIINELYYRSLINQLSNFEYDMVFATGKINLAQKIQALRQQDLQIAFADFGTRRRFSRGWQYYVVKVLAEELPNHLFGTSNTKIAMDYGLLPIGTAAHEMDMVMSGIMHNSNEEIRASHNQVLQEWWSLYGWGLSVALTDTYGTDFFLQDMTASQARDWKGLRQDSGDPFEFGEKVIKFYKNKGIDPKKKIVIFSDGLDVAIIIKLATHFRDRLKVSFGWGTNLTNDLGFSPLSLVIKTVEANGYGLVKLSDNIAKAIGKPEDIEYFKNIFGYAVALNQECKY